jgi:hypothetical protein
VPFQNKDNGLRLNVPDPNESIFNASGQERAVGREADGPNVQFFLFVHSGGVFKTADQLPSRDRVDLGMLIAACCEKGTVQGEFDTANDTGMMQERVCESPASPTHRTKARARAKKGNDKKDEPLVSQGMDEVDGILGTGGNQFSPWIESQDGFLTRRLTVLFSVGS